MSKKLSVLKTRRLRNLKIFLSFSYYNFEDRVTNLEKDMFRKESLTYLQNLNSSVFSDLSFWCKAYSLSVKNGLLSFVSNS